MTDKEVALEKDQERDFVMINGNKNNAKNQHVVPNCLLKNFATKNGNNDHYSFFQFDIQKYKKGDKNYYDSKKTYKAIGAEKHFYNAKNFDGSSFSIEDFLSENENLSAPIFQKIIKKKSTSILSNDEKEVLLDFAINLFMRSPCFENSLPSNDEFKELFKNARTFNDQANRYCLSKSKRNDIFNYMWSNEYEPINLAKLSRNEQIVDMRSYLKDKIGTKNYFVEEFRNHLFISDNPVIMDNGTSGLTDSIFYFPISSHFLLIITPSNIKYSDLSIPSSRYCNLAQIQNAKRFIYSKRNRKDFLSKCFNKNPHLYYFPFIPFYKEYKKSKNLNS